MRKEMGSKILLFAILGLVMVSFLAGVVSADAFTDFFNNGAKAIFSQWSSGEQFNTDVAKILLTIVIALLVFSVMSKIPGLEPLFEKDRIFLGYLISFIVGFLSMAYITPSEVYAIISTYSAMGFALGVGFPFVILLFFTITLATEPPGRATEMIFRKILAIGIWAAFAFFLIYRIVIRVNTSGVPGYAVYNTLTWVLLMVTIGIVLFMGLIFRKLNKMATTESMHKYVEESVLQDEKRKVDAAQISGTLSPRGSPWGAP